MALKKEVLQKIASVLKLDEKALTDAIAAAEEKDLVIPEIQTFTAEELTARDEAKLTEGKKTGLKEGETQGKEIAVKEMKKAFGVEFEGKDFTKLVDTVKTQLGKGDEGLKQQITQLQATLSDKDKLIAAKEQEAHAAIFDANLLAALPSNRKSVADGGFTDAEYLAAIKANLQFETVDGAQVVKKAGQIVQDPKTYKPLPVPEVISSYFTERKWAGEATPPGGRGGGDGKPTGGKAAKLSEAMAEWEKQGKSTSTAEFQQHVNALVKENKDFEFDAV